MIDNSWGISQYLLIPGHEVVGRVVSIGAGVDASLIGHMALQSARAWGCEVTALTTDLSKADEARGFGAQNVMLLEELPALAGRFNLVIKYGELTAGLVCRDGIFGSAGALASAGSRVAAHTSWCFRFDFFSSLYHRQSYLVTREPSKNDGVLRKHAINPQVEHLPFDQVNQAIERLHRGDVRYRFVLDQAA